MKEIIIDGVTYICTPKEEEKVEHEFIDLGLPSGRLWATCNIGAKKPTDCGDYFAYGVVKPYKIKNDNTYNLLGPCAANISEIDDEHDAAKVLWGDEWRMPTLTDFAELIDNCTYFPEFIDGITCGVFTSKLNKQKIIMPAAGGISGGTLYCSGRGGNYWSRSLNTSSEAWSLDFNSITKGVYISSYCEGFPIRPVRDFLIKVINK